MKKKHIIYIGIILFVLGILSLFLDPITNGTKTDYLINNLIGSYKILLPRTTRPNLGINLYVNLFLYIMLFTGILMSLKTKWKRTSILFISISIMFIDNILNFISKSIYFVRYHNFEVFPLERRILPFLQYAILIIITFKILKNLRNNKPYIPQEVFKYFFLGYVFDFIIIWFLFVKIAIAIERNFEIYFVINLFLSFSLVSLLYFALSKILIKNTSGEIIIKTCSKVPYKT